MFQIEEMTSFLLRYPITKLSTTEALQVEMLMVNLNILKPEFRIANLFTVGGPLIVSVENPLDF